MILFKNLLHVYPGKASNTAGCVSVTYINTTKYININAKTFPPTKAY